MEWVLVGLGVVAAGGLIWWAASKVERERAGQPPPSEIRVDGIFSGPVGTGIYKPIDNRREAERSAHEDVSSGQETDRPGRSGS